jgi:hypothetical protein
MKRECLDRSYFVERGTAGSRGSSTHVSKDVKSSRLHVFTSSRLHASPPPPCPISARIDVHESVVCAGWTVESDAAD